MNNLIPIYYHVPKCGGTYFYHMMSKMSEEIHPTESHCIHVHDDVIYNELSNQQYPKY